MRETWNLKDLYENEVWVKTYHPNYAVSSWGNAWNVKTRKLVGYVLLGQYPAMCINYKVQFISRVIWHSFFKEWPVRLRYIDGNTFNCALENLEKDPKCKKNFLLDREEKTYDAHRGVILIDTYHGTERKIWKR